MYRSVKISDDAYREAKKLAKDLNKSRDGRFGIANAIEFALKRAVDAEKRKIHLRAASGGWKDMDPIIVEDIYKGRLVSTRQTPGL